MKDYPQYPAGYRKFGKKRYHLITHELTKTRAKKFGKDWRKHRGHARIISWRGKWYVYGLENLRGRKK